MRIRFAARVAVIIVSALLALSLSQSALLAATFTPATITDSPAAVLIAQATAVPAKKVDYPQKGRMVNVLVPSTAGNSSDIGARFLSALLEKQMGVRFQVTNKPGAGWQIGTTELIRSKPDGYTIGLINAPTTLITYLDPERKAVYTRKDFDPLALIMIETTTIAVKADSPFKTAKDLFDAAKAKPGTLKVGDGGLKTASHLAALQVAKAAGVDFSFVHFDGGGPAVTAVMGGHLDAAIVGAGNLMTNYKNGEIRLLAVMDRQESPFFPGIKTLESQGGYKVYFPISYGLALPAPTPKEILDILGKEVEKAMTDPTLKVKMADMGLEHRYMNAAAFGSYWAETESQVKPLLEMAGSK